MSGVKTEGSQAVKQAALGGGDQPPEILLDNRLHHDFALQVAADLVAKVSDGVVWQILSPKCAFGFGGACRSLEGMVTPQQSFQPVALTPLERLAGRPIGEYLYQHFAGFAAKAGVKG